MLIGVFAFGLAVSFASPRGAADGGQDGSPASLRATWPRKLDARIPAWPAAGCATSSRVRRVALGRHLGRPVALRRAAIRQLHRCDRARIAGELGDGARRWREWRALDRPRAPRRASRRRRSSAARRTVRRTAAGGRAQSGRNRDGTLWIGTAAGLWRWRAAGGLEAWHPTALPRRRRSTASWPTATVESGCGPASTGSGGARPVKSIQADAPDCTDSTSRRARRPPVHRLRRGDLGTPPGSARWVEIAAAIGRSGCWSTARAPSGTVPTTDWCATAAASRRCPSPSASATPGPARFSRTSAATSGSAPSRTGSPVCAAARSPPLESRGLPIRGRPPSSAGRTAVSGWARSIRVSTCGHRAPE